MLAKLLTHQPTVMAVTEIFSFVAVVLDVMVLIVFEWPPVHILLVLLFEWLPLLLYHNFLKF